MKRLFLSLLTIVAVACGYGVTPALAAPPVAVHVTPAHTPAIVDGTHVAPAILVFRHDAAWMHDSLATESRVASFPVSPVLAVRADAPRRLMPALDSQTIAERLAPAQPFPFKSLALLLAGVALMGTVKTVVNDKDTYPATQTTRQQLNQLIADMYYIHLNGLIAVTAATWPACAIATTTTKAKTTNATVLLCNGVLVALGITDNYWTLTGGVQAAGTIRRYLLLSNAAGVASVQQSSDVLAAAGAAACAWASRPAAGVAIVGIVTVTTDATHTFTPGTTALNAAGITAAFIDSIDDSVFLAAQVTP